MKNMEKYLSILSNEVDGLLLTSRYSRYYCAEYDIAEGVAVVTKSGCRYFTDSRYIEAAQNTICGFEVMEMNRANPYNKLLNDAKVNYVSQLINKPVEVTIEDRIFKSFRILTEVL